MPEVLSYHRVESTTQSMETAARQEASQELWGRPARGSGISAVKAYRGPLPDQRRGIDIQSDLPPEKGSGTPLEARWYYPKTEGTFLRKNESEEFAAIKARITNKQL